MNRRAFLSHGRSSRRDRDTASMALSYWSTRFYHPPLGGNRRSGKAAAGAGESVQTQAVGSAMIRRAAARNQHRF
jgi:hypothetical protein